MEFAAVILYVPGTLDIDPLFEVREWTALAAELNIFHGKFNGQLIFRHRHGAARLAVNDWNGSTPVSNARGLFLRSVLSWAVPLT